RHADLVRGERPDLPDHPHLVADRPGLHDAGLVERRGLGDLARIDAARDARHVEARAEGGDEQRREHADRDGDARQDPRQLVQIDGRARLHGLASYPEPQIGVDPEAHDDHQVDQDEDERALRVLLLLLLAVGSGRGHTGSPRCPERSAARFWSSASPRMRVRQLSQTRSSLALPHTRHGRGALTDAGRDAGALRSARTEAGTISTRHGASRTTVSATLPRIAWVTPVRPWVPTTIRSMRFSRA